VLREVERVLVPEGQVVIAGFNPLSLFGLRRRLAGEATGYPWHGQYLSLRRLKDWLALLGFETGLQASGCFVPAVDQEVAAPPHLAGLRRRALVADRRGRLHHPGDQAGAWHAPDHAQMGPPGRRPGAGAPHTESGRPPKGCSQKSTDERNSGRD
jgi:hypothetical protein